MTATLAHRFRRSIRGEGGFGTIISLIILLVAVYAGYKLIPVYIKIWDFEEKVSSIPRELAAQRGGVEPEIISKALYDEARKIGLPVEESNIKVELTSRTIIVTVRYTVIMEFPGYTWKKDVFNEYSGHIYRS